MERGHSRTFLRAVRNVASETWQDAGLLVAGALAGASCASWEAPSVRPGAGAAPAAAAGQYDTASSTAAATATRQAAGPMP